MSLSFHPLYLFISFPLLRFSFFSVLLIPCVLCGLLSSLPSVYLSIPFFYLPLCPSPRLSYPLPAAKPKNSAKVVTVQAGTKSVVVAQCEAAEGKPAATIKWLASVGGNHSTSTTNGPDGTVTVRSEYRLVPTPTDNGREVTCMVDQRTQERPWVYPVKLSVECKEDTQKHRH